MRVRPTAVAGRFYPDDPAELRGSVEGFLDFAPAWTGPPPRALVAPHAGYVYSGMVAAHAFAAVRGPLGAGFERVVLLGPSHYVHFGGLALPKVEAFATPLGEIPLDPDARRELEGLDTVLPADAPHAREHSLEVELPFLQVALGDFRLVALAAGDESPERVAAVIDRLAGERTLVVVSTDLSHFLPCEEARARDERTSRAIESLAWEEIGRDDACGRVPLRGLLAWARARSLACRRLDLKNSADTIGPPDRVVGYGAYAFA